ncbi:ImmA/IrrE family metallo-endopeptidase [Pirellulaceae bacterium SH449]
MRQGSRQKQYHEHVQSVIDEMGVEDPREAIRLKMRNKIAEISSLFGEPPYDLIAFASCVGLQWSDESPAFSNDSEIAPIAGGRMLLRVNQERPLTRQRFSIAHEIGHTLFPDYQYSVKCRKANERRWSDDDLLESLCDVAASELMFPTPWFTEKLASLDYTGVSLLKLADDCLASREATVRRIVELSQMPLAAVFFSWKHKPVELRALRRRKSQTSLFPELEPPPPSPMLRVDYSIINEAFRRNFADHIPEHKSVPSDGLIFGVSLRKVPGEGHIDLDLGPLKGRFYAVVLPIFTELSDCANSSVVVLILPSNM